MQTNVSDHFLMIKFVNIETIMVAMQGRILGKRSLVPQEEGKPLVKPVCQVASRIRVYPRVVYISK